MTAKIRFAAILTALTVAAAVTLPSSEAEARNRGGAIAVGVIGGALLGAAIAGHAHAHSGPAYYEPGPRCRWVAEYDRWGNYMGRTRVCHRR